MIREGLFGTATSTTFTYIMIFFFGCAIVEMLINILIRKKKPQFFLSAPAILTSIGLFGTFWGVAEGLYNFDATNIDSSVIKLLEGMKLAFWTSIFGMLLALLINIIGVHIIIPLFSKLARSITKQETKSNIGAADIYNAINESSGHLKDLVDSIGGDQNNSLLTQFRLLDGNTQKTNSAIYELRDATKAAIQELGNNNKMAIQELRDETKAANSELLNAFNEFATKVSENNSKALIEALESVIKDFNAKISEQFGDNFKELNTAVGKLLTWQEQYRAQLISLVEQFKVAQDGIESTRQGIEDIKNNLSSVPNVMQEVRNAIVKVNNGLVEEEEILKGFIALRNKADEVFPTIKGAIDNLTDGIKADIETITYKLSQDITRSHQAVVDSSTAFVRSVNEQNKSIDGLSSKVAKTTVNMENIIEQGVDDLQQKFRDSADQIGKALKEDIEDINTELEAIHKKAMQSLGIKMGSVMEKLVNEYQTMLTKLPKLIETISSNYRRN